MLLGVPEAAELAGVSKARIYAAIRQGSLVPVEGIPCIALKREDVKAWRDRDRAKGGRGKKVETAPKKVKKKKREAGLVPPTPPNAPATKEVPE